MDKFKKMSNKSLKSYIKKSKDGDDKVNAKRIRSSRLVKKFSNPKSNVDSKARSSRLSKLQSYADKGPEQTKKVEPKKAKKKIVKKKAASTPTPQAKEAPISKAKKKAEFRKVLKKVTSKKPEPKPSSPPALPSQGKKGSRKKIIKSLPKTSDNKPASKSTPKPQPQAKKKVIVKKASPLKKSLSSTIPNKYKSTNAGTPPPLPKNKFGSFGGTRIDRKSKGSKQARLNKAIKKFGPNRFKSMDRANRVHKLMIRRNVNNLRSKFNNPFAKAKRVVTNTVSGVKKSIGNKFAKAKSKALAKLAGNKTERFISK